MMARRMTCRAVPIGIHMGGQQQLQQQHDALRRQQSGDGRAHAHAPYAQQPYAHGDSGAQSARAPAGRADSGFGAPHGPHRQSASDGMAVAMAGSGSITDPRGVDVAPRPASMGADALHGGPGSGEPAVVAPIALQEDEPVRRLRA
jgi:hypothetical protein